MNGQLIKVSSVWIVQLSYTPLLLSVSRLDDNAGDGANK
jgi:hypothetical protein